MQFMHNPYLVEPHVSFLEQDDEDVDELEIVPEHFHHVLNVPEKQRDRFGQKLNNKILPIFFEDVIRSKTRCVHNGKLEGILWLDFQYFSRSDFFWLFNNIINV